MLGQTHANAHACPGMHVQQCSAVPLIIQIRVKHLHMYRLALVSACLTYLGRFVGQDL